MQTCMVLGKLASNSSDHIVPSADMYGIRKLGWQFMTILCPMQTCMVLGNLASNSSDDIVPNADMYGIRKLG